MRRAEHRLNAWMGREWSGVLTYADQRGRDAFDFDPIASPYLEIADTFIVRTPYSRTVIAELREVPWSSWDPALKAWRVPFRSIEDLRKHWPAIEDAARHAEPKERRRRAESEKASPENEKRRVEATERRRKCYPVPDDAPPPLDQVVTTHAGCLVFEEITGEIVEAETVERFYPGVQAGSGTLIWSTWHRPCPASLRTCWRSPQR
ncbi:hypothetical protein [Falsiroseomonas sp. HW251]|uniref:hypothetical protein n=1 Tax=Falsiroseomonas sp. HW251 TaxID=3390998 RepID=UPI003D31112D